MASNRFGPLADLEPSLRAFSQAVAMIVEKIQRPDQQSYKQVLLHPVKPEDPVNKAIGQSFWRKSDSRGEQLGRLDRSTIVTFNLEELRCLSSPSHPLCFRCGDRGHRASDCRNAILCFACNRLGHRSSQCRAVTDLTMQPPPTNDLTTKPPPLTPPNAGSGSCQKSITVYYEVSVMDSIKRLETGLSEIKQELALMTKRRSEMETPMAGINAQIHSSQSKLAKIEVAKAAQRSAIREEKRWEDDSGISICSINKRKDPMYSEEVVHAIETVRQQEYMTEI